MAKNDDFDKSVEIFVQACAVIVGGPLGALASIGLACAKAANEPPKSPPSTDNSIKSAGQPEQ